MYAPTERSKDTCLKIAVIGDVHGAWDAEDELALRHLGVDLVLFVGDFGNEAVEVVRAIAALSLPKAVVLGNHDAWYSATEWGIKKCPYDRQLEDRVQQQLELLGDIHVGYSKLDFPEFELTVVGSRPFSWGGPEWKSVEFYGSRYGIHSFEESAAQIVQSVKQSTYDTVIFLGHCGPTGLGERAEDPCGKDWEPIGGDHGDPDLALAIEETHRLGKQVALVTFGHMHHQLRHNKHRLRTAVTYSPGGTVYVNAASVPRIVRADSLHRRNFSIVSLEAGCVSQVALVWIDQDFTVVSEQILYPTGTGIPQLQPKLEIALL